MTKIKTLQLQINEVKEFISNIEKDLEDLKKGGGSGLSEYLQSYDKYKKIINGAICDPGTKSIFDNTKLYAQLKLQYIADKLNDGWKPDWNNSDESKFECVFRHDNNTWGTNSCTTFQYQSTYFKSQKLMEIAHDIMGSDMEYLK
jgi:hypothetical protein